MARADPGAFVIGVDADSSSLVDPSRRAARRKGGVPNAMFVVAAVEALPPELDGLVDDVRIHFPWGSLLRSLLLADPAVILPLARICRTGASVQVVWSLTPRERGTGLLAADPRALVATLAGLGLAVDELREASPEEVVATGSSWAKRLGVGRARPATLLRARRR